MKDKNTLHKDLYYKTIIKENSIWIKRRELKSIKLFFCEIIAL